MTLKINKKNIWSELSQKALNDIKNKKMEELQEEVPQNINEEYLIQKEQEYIEEVVEAITYTSEDVHGGNEATGDIEDSPNASNNGINEINSHYVESNIDIETNWYGENDCKTDLSIYIINAVIDIYKKYSNSKTSNGYRLYDTRKIVKHLLSHQEYKIPKDKYSKSESKDVLFFIDTSGSVIDYYTINESIKMLEKIGFNCYICGAGNGFIQEDMDDDPYGVRQTLIDIGAGKLAKIVRPSLTSAIKMANEATFSIIIADFDGLSDFVKLSLGVSKNKIPYFLSTENRYSWDNPTEHDWVEENFCYYPKERIYTLLDYED